jgi:hypothetical protein
MPTAPSFDDWKDLRAPVLAPIAAGLTSRPKAFHKAMREVLAAALTLLFARARSLWADDEDADQELRDAQKPGRLGGLRLAASADVWRNPPATAYRMEPQPGASRKTRL